MQLVPKELGYHDHTAGPAERARDEALPEGALCCVDVRAVHGDHQRTASHRRGQESERGGGKQIVRVNEVVLASHGGCDRLSEQAPVLENGGKPSATAARHDQRELDTVVVGQPALLSRDE